MFKKIDNDRALVFDTEATCWDVNDFSTKEEGRKCQFDNREIIEIGIVEIDLIKREVIKKRRYLVKPRTSRVSDFCTKLTGLTQELVDNEGEFLQFTTKQIKKDFSPKNKYIMSWGAFDPSFMENQCKLSKNNAAYPFQVIL